MTSGFIPWSKAGCLRRSRSECGSKLRNEVLQLNRELAIPPGAARCQSRSAYGHDLKDLFWAWQLTTCATPWACCSRITNGLRRAELNEEHQRYLGTCLRVAEQMRDLINNSLTWL